MLQAFVTGADRGVGLALTALLLERGYRVFAGRYASVEKGLDALQEAKGDSLVQVALDVGDDNSVREAAAIVAGMTDRLDLLLNNAAILGDIQSTIWQPLDYEEMLRVYNVNTLGALRVSNAFAGLLLEGETKLIVNISSEAGSLGNNWRDSWFAYCMSKAALNMQSNLIHQGIKPQGGRVLVIHPGWVQTHMQGKLDAAAALTPQQSAEGILQRVEEQLAQTSVKDQPDYLAYDGEPLPW